MNNTRTKSLKLDSIIALKGMKKSEVSELLGLTGNAFYKKRNGKSDFTKTEIDTLLNFFNVKYEELF